MAESPITTRTAVLFALAQGEAYRHELAQRIELMPDGEVQAPSAGQLVPALRQLVEDGLVEVYEPPREDGERGARKRVHRLTAAGLERARWTRKVVLAYASEEPTMRAARRASGSRRV